MNPPENTENSDPLDILLQEQNHYIEDAGFTARVLTSLPQSSRRSWLRPVLLVSVSLAGLFLFISWLPWQSLPSLDGPPLSWIDSKVFLPWLMALTVLASLVWGMVAASQLED
ncbi:MAG TPA: DUF5056 domain-containing protein [Candidatus Saccharimonadales bacterium]|nr:DUF5056 domain-containing protein [Candidatus Saccharimonadales bacterium]